MPIADIWWTHRARAGDSRAWNVLFQRHAPRIYNLLRRLGASTEEAEDLTQETFVTAFRSVASWQGRGAFASWLCGIAVHAYRNHFRATRREENDEPLDDNTQAPLSGDPLACLARAETGKALTDAIADLSPLCREAFVLVYVEQFSYREAADFLQVPVGTVQSRLNRAKRRLHTSLSPYFAEGTVPAATYPKGVSPYVP